jgi:hypothetical protein
MEVPTSMSSTFTATQAPTFNLEGDFAEYERDVRLWSVIIDIAEVEKGAVCWVGCQVLPKTFVLHSTLRML